MSRTPLLGLERDINPSTLTHHLRKNFDILDKVVGNGGFVNLAEYVTYGSGVSSEVRKANRAGYKTAYDLANAQGKTLYQKAGDLEIEIDESGDFDGNDPNITWIGVRLDGDVNIVGAGRRRTKIKFFPNIPTFNAYAFFQDSGRHNSITDCTITGPTQGNDKPNPVYFGIKHQGNHDAAVFTDETLVLKNVKIDGKFVAAVTSNEGDLICTLDGCDLSAYVQAVGYHVNFNTHKQLIIRNCHIHDSGLHALRAALVYVSPGVSIDISHSRFSASERFGVYINGTTNVKPLYSRITNNIFEETLAQAIQVARNNRPLIQGNLIKTKRGGIELFGSFVGADILDNEFIQPANAELQWQSIAAESLGSGAVVKIHGNTFDASAGKDVGLSKVIYMNGWLTIWDVVGNLFRLNNFNMSGIDSGTDNLMAFVNGNKFTGGACGTCVAFKGGTVYAKGNIIEVDSGIVFSFINNSLARARIDDNDTVASSNLIALYVYLTTASEGKILGSGNRFLSDRAQVPGTVSYQLITPKVGVCPTVVASKANTFLPMSYDTVHISGNVPINNFYYGHPDATRLFCGEIKVIFDDEGATLTAAGNIKPETTGNRVVGKVYRFLFDGPTRSWNE